MHCSLDFGKEVRGAKCMQDGNTRRKAFVVRCCTDQASLLSITLYGPFLAAVVAGALASAVAAAVISKLISQEEVYLGGCLGESKLG